MSNYGADANPDLIKTYDLMIAKALTPVEGVNVMQWTYSGRVVRKLARRQDHTNILFKLED